MILYQSDIPSFRFRTYFVFVPYDDELSLDETASLCLLETRAANLRIDKTWRVMQDMQNRRNLFHLS